MKRAVIIGLDGVSYTLLSELAANNVMPHVRQVIERGTFKKMASSIPEISSVAWSSIITGKNPGEHGIFGFTDFPRGTYRLSFPNFSSLKSPAFWECDRQRRHIVLNVPSTYPARELNGVLISGFVALDFERAVYPQTMVSVLKNMNYKIDVDSERAHESFEFFLRDLDATLDVRIATCRHLWKEVWDVFMVVFTGTDRLMHFLWDAYEDKEHPLRSAFLEHFRKVDAAIGDIINKLNNDDVCVLLSDHGFEKLEYDVHVNYFLKEQGFLNLEASSMVGFGSIAQGTKAFALDPARIYVNLQGKYPRGSVPESGYNDIVEELEGAFNNLRIEGKKVIARIYRKQEIYHGPLCAQAPDVVLVGADGFNLKASINAQTLYEKGIFSGKHNAQAFLLINSKDAAQVIPDAPVVSDVVSMLNNLRGGNNEQTA